MCRSPYTALILEFFPRTAAEAASPVQVHVYEQLRSELKAIVKAKCDALNDVAALRIIVKQQVGGLIRGLGF